MPDEKIIAALLSCSTNRAAANKIGLSEWQLYKRMRDPEFKAKMQEARARMLDEAATVVSGYVREAALTAVLVMRDDTVSAQTRLNAADAILRNALKMTERCDITERLDALESAMEDGHNGGWR